MSPFGGSILSNVSYAYKSCALRPVVSLNTNLIGENNTSKIYYTGININQT